MRLMVDGYWWLDGPPSGRAVLRNTVLMWAECYPADRLLVVVPNADLAEAQPHPANVEFVRSRLGLHPLINYFEIPRIARRMGIDVVLSQNFGVPLPKSLVFVHDTIFVRHPDWFTRKERMYLRFIKLTIRPGMRILTSSTTESVHIGRDLARSNPVSSVGLGLNPDLLSSCSSAPAFANGLDGFLLTVGRLNIRKNLENTILGALNSGVITPKFPLLVVGSPDGRSDLSNPHIDHAIETGLVRFTGYLVDKELKWLYKHCALMIYLSLEEGFGLPPLEAAFFGQRPLVSDIAVFHEVLDDLADYVDPLDVHQIQNSIRILVRSPLSESSQRTAHAYAHGSLYGWLPVVARIRSESESYE